MSPPTRPRKVVLACVDMLYDQRYFEEESRAGRLCPFNYSVRKILAAIRQDPALGDVEAVLVEAEPSKADEFAERILAHDPDLVGFSAYVWSFPLFAEVSVIIKRRRPDCAIVFGGPSARPEMFDLPPYAEAARLVDACVIREGEFTIQEILRLPKLDRASLAGVSGLAISADGHWHYTPERPLLNNLDLLASPFQSGIAPGGVSAHLETFRGCPLTCRFCQWGVMGNTTRVFSTEYLVRELSAYRDAKAQGAFLIDAGLNLNSRAFKNLAEAERQVGFLKSTFFQCEIYPSFLNEQHLEFLAQMRSFVSIGLQSYDHDVLRTLDRFFDTDKFDRLVGAAAKIASETAVEMILGLPGDNPVSFRKSVERAMRLPATVRIFQLLVLPDALMSRPPDDAQIVFDPITLKMISCRGWSERDLQETVDWLESFLERDVLDAHEHSSSWHTSDRTSAPPTGPSVPEIRTCELEGELTRSVVESALRRASSGDWSLRTIRTDGPTLLIDLDLPDGELTVAARRAEAGSKHYKIVDGVGYSYRAESSRMNKPLLVVFDRVIAELARGRSGGSPRSLPMVMNG